jgi:hypothetical protein
MQSIIRRRIGVLLPILLLHIALGVYFVKSHGFLHANDAAANTAAPAQLVMLFFAPQKAPSKPVKHAATTAIRTPKKPVVSNRAVRPAQAITVTIPARTAPLADTIVTLPTKSGDAGSANRPSAPGITLDLSHIGKIAKELEQEKPRLPPTVPPSFQRKLEHGIAAAARPRETTLTDYRQADGRVITKVSGPLGVYCIMSGVSLGVTHGRDNPEPMVLYVNCPKQ